ncbi:MAG: sialidase family protein [Acidimicrobiales bacterium]
MTRVGGGRRGRRTALALAAALFAGLALAAAVLMITTDTSAEVGQNVFVNPAGPIDANNSPTVARNPTQPRNVVVVHRVDLPGFSASLQISFDGGRAWQTTALPLPAGLDRPFAPDVAFAQDGTLYVTYVNLQGAGNRPNNLWLSKSTDGGRTLSEPVRIAGDLAFQARLAVDAGGTVYVTWLKVADVAPYAIVAYPSPVVLVRSDDGGTTFSEPVAVSDAERQRVGAASPAVDSAGNVVVLYQDFKRDSRDYQNLDGPVWEEPFALVVTTSRDGGRTWSKGVEVDDSVVPTKRFLVFLPEFPSIAAGPNGSLYVAWADGRNGDLDAFVRRSTDGGVSWGAPVRVNDNRLKDGTDQYMPQVDVAPGGRVDVVFYDRRSDPSNLLTETYLAYSDDDGQTFENLPVSSAPFDSRVGFSANAKVEPDFGSRLGIHSDDDETLTAWTDTRLGTEDTARQDVALARVQVSTKESPALARLPVAAVLLGLSALCLVGWRLSGRTRPRRDDREPEDHDTKVEPEPADRSASADQPGPGPAPSPGAEPEPAPRSVEA